MTYRIFYTDRRLTAPVAEPDYAKLMPLQSNTEEDAVAKAFAVMSQGGIVWKIDGPKGVFKNKVEIAHDYWKATGRRAPRS